MICFQISIFEPLETTTVYSHYDGNRLWFAFKLVSLNHWKQRSENGCVLILVVICFQISIFEPLETTDVAFVWYPPPLWFAFKLVSLNHWKQLTAMLKCEVDVVICFQISIFEPLETTSFRSTAGSLPLWFAFKLVSLNHWKQRQSNYRHCHDSCDLLSN